jgi:hypothetical protein
MAETRSAGTQPWPSSTISATVCLCGASPNRSDDGACMGISLCGRVLTRLEARLDVPDRLREEPILHVQLLVHGVSCCAVSRPESLNHLQGSSPDPWTDLAGVKPNGQQSTALWICSNDVLRGRSSPIEKTIPSWPRHACEVLCVKGGCVGGSPIGAFKGLWSCAFAILVQSQVGIQ